MAAVATQNVLGAARLHVHIMQLSFYEDWKM